MKKRKKLEKNQTVEVVNLSTGKEQTYTNCIPSEAVMWAWLEDKGDCNTWGYNKKYLKHYPSLVWGKETVAMGDFCASTKLKD